MSLGQQGGELLGKEMYQEAQDTLCKALERFKEARQALGEADPRLLEVITRNEQATHSNILFARIGQALLAAREGLALYQKGEYDQAEEVFQKARSQVQDAVTEARSRALKGAEEEGQRKLAELAQNIEACQVARDAKKVEGLVEQAKALGERAEKAIGAKRLAEASGILEEARQIVKNAFDIAIQRQFQESLTGINQLRQCLDKRLNDVYSALERGVTEVPLRDERLTVTPPPGPKIPVEVQQVAPWVASDWEEQYEIVRLIGQGGYADVYLAKRKSDGFQVALKVPRGVASGQTLPDRLLRLFEQEASNWLRLKHPHIVELYQYGQHPYPWLAMEYMPGGVLTQRLGKLGLRQALDIFVKICRAVEYAHRGGYVHKDIKPDNILFTAEGEPKVSDWGLARHYFDPSYGRDYSFTPLYCAPEQVSRDTYGDYDHPGDVFQLGLVFYHTLTGQHPFLHPGEDLTQLHPLDPAARIANPDFQVAPPSDLRPQLPKAVDTVILCCLRVHPRERYREVYLLREALEEIARSL